jgi:hypothetical protein
MADCRIRDTFNQRFFVSQNNRVGFAWERTRVRELYGDIVESMFTRSKAPSLG